jgi:hypothetical protein
MDKVDYTKFGDGKAPQGEELQSVARKWWLCEDPEDLVSAVTATVYHLQQRQVSRLTQHVISTRLYGNMAMPGLAGWGYSRVGSNASVLRERISYNVVQSAIDTITAKIAKNKPRPLFLTTGGDYRLQRMAKKLNQFIDGVFYENNAYALGVEAFRDGAVFGDGLIHVYTKGNRIQYERTLSSELWVDELEGFYGEPRTMHRAKNVDRQVLLELFPDKELQTKILNCEKARAEDSGTWQSISDLVTVRESWHLPSGPKAKDGVRTLTIGNALLVREEWKHDFFPFARFRWCPRLFGYWSQGLAEQLQNIQFEINKLLQLIQRSFHLGGTFKVFLENTSKIVKEHINNDVGAIITYAGTKPDYVTPPLVQQEIFGHLITLKAAAFEQAGISMLSATSQKPAGLNSGRALREYQDIESDRFMTIGQQYEETFLTLARMTVELAKEIRGKYEVQAPGRKFLRTINWKDIDLEEDQYVMQVYPVSKLPNDPAGRLETIQEYMQAGLLTPRAGKRLLDFPDLDAVENLQNAAEDYLEMIFEKIVDDGEYTPPEPFDDLQLAKEMALEHYSWGRSQGLEEERLEMLRRFLEQISGYEQAAQQQQMVQQMQAAQAQQAQAQPTAAPVPPPQNPMIPNAPGLA